MSQTASGSTWRYTIAVSAQEIDKHGGVSNGYDAFFHYYHDELEVIK